MLVLTRKRSEMIQIGEDIVIKVIKTANGTVKLGIDAPAHVRVMRAELLGEGHAAKYGPAVPGMHKPVGSPIPASVPVPSDQFPQPHVA